MRGSSRTEVSEASATASPAGPSPPAGCSQAGSSIGGSPSAGGPGGARLGRSGGGGPPFSLFLFTPQEQGPPHPVDQITTFKVNVFGFTFPATNTQKKTPPKKK